MRNRAWYLAAVWVIGALLGSGAAWAARPEGEARYYMGEVLMPNAACPRLEFVVSMSRNDTGVWTGRMSIPRGCGAEGAIGMALLDLSVSDTSIAFSTAAPPARNVYSAAFQGGEAVGKGRVLIGGTQPLEIRMWRVSEEEARNAAPRRPQTPDGIPAYDVSAVIVPAPLADDPQGKLSGTLTIPKGDGPFAAVVLVSDAEAQDRDGSEGTHQPELILADRLTRAGFAVLRCDDRGLGDSSGSYSNITLEEAAKDVAAQVGMLGGTPRIDRARIGVVGRGEGALVASMAASGGSGIAFAVLLSPAGHTGVEVGVLREKRQLEAVGEDPGYIEARVGRLRGILELARDGGKTDELRKALQDDARAYVGATRGMGLPMTEDQVAMWADSRQEMLDRVRYRSWLSTDPTVSLKALACPVLVVAGDMDMINPTADELPIVREALKGAKSAEVKELPGTNHWLQPCSTGYEDERDQIETTISEAALGEIVSYLRGVTGK